MGVYFAPAYSLPGGDQPLTHARIAHSGNWFQNVIATPSSTAAGYSATGPMGNASFEKWSPYDNLIDSPTDITAASWAKTNATATGNLFAETSATGNHAITDTNESVFAAPIVFCVEASAHTRTQIRLLMSDGTLTYTCYFDLAAGTVGAATGAGTVGTIKSVGGGRYKCFLRVSSPSVGTGSFGIRLVDGTGSDSYTGDGSSGVYIYSAWAGRSGSTYDIDLGAAKQADYLCIGAHNIGSAGGTVQLLYDNAGYTAIMAATPTDDSPIWFMFPPQTRRNWRVSFTASCGVEVGNIKLGKALQFERSIQPGYGPVNLQRETEYRTNWSATGELLGRTVQRKFLNGQFTWPLMPKTWIDANWPNFVTAAENDPFYIIPVPSRTNEAAFCVAEGFDFPQYVGVTDMMNCGLQVRAYA